VGHVAHPFYLYTGNAEQACGTPTTTHPSSRHKDVKSYSASSRADLRSTAKPSSYLVAQEKSMSHEGTRHLAKSITSHEVYS